MAGSIFDTFIEQNKQSVGNSAFDAITGLIKGGLENSGVDVKSQIVPIATNEKKEQISNVAGLPSDIGKYLMYGGIAVVAFLVYKKMKKGRV